MKKTIVIVEDAPGVRRQFLQILDGIPDVECVGNFASAEEALKNIPRIKPDVVLMDIKLPKMSGIQCVAQLKKLMPWVQFIIVTVYEDGESIFNALKAGACGYLIKSDPPEQVIQAIREISLGGAPMSSHIARKVVEHFHATESLAAESKQLSPRERQVLCLLASGHLYKEIAAKLGIAVETARGYVRSACEKMHVRSRIELVAKHYNAQNNP